MMSLVRSLELADKLHQKNGINIEENPCNLPYMNPQVMNIPQIPTALFIPPFTVPFFPFPPENQNEEPLKQEDEAVVIKREDVFKK